MYTAQVDLYAFIKRFTEPASTPETLIFVVYLRFRPARVLAICGRFRGPISGPPGRFLGPPSATPLPTQKARNHYFYNVLALDRRPPGMLGEAWMGVCLGCAWRVPGVCLGCAWGMHGVCLA